jgi:hypothetical protein
MQTRAMQTGVPQAIVPALARLFSTLLALALTALGVVAIVEVVAAWLGRGWYVLPADTTARLQHWRWNDRPVVLTIAAVGAIGLVAILIGVWRRDPLTVPIDAAHDVTFDRRALERSLRRRLEAIDGVNRAHVAVKRDRLLARVDTDRRYEPAELKERVETMLSEVAERQRIQLGDQVRLRYRGGEV